jgi:glutathione S-transferase
MAMLSALFEFDIYEISLREKPKEMLKISPKGTVPVLIVGNNIIDESLDIMIWAYNISDKSNHYISLSKSEKNNAKELINLNDNDFKLHLDKYKYSNQKEFWQDKFYKNCLFFINRIESNLCANKFLISNKISIADIAIFPFIRQFANVNLDRFINGEFKKTISWFEKMNEQDLFYKAMLKPSV